MSEMSYSTTTLTDEEITRQLLELEDRFTMTSEQFLRAYNTGQLGEDDAFIDWAGLLYVAHHAGVTIPSRV